MYVKYMVSSIYVDKAIVGSRFLWIMIPFHNAFVSNVCIQKAGRAGLLVLELDKGGSVR